MLKIVVADDEGPIRDWLAFLIQRHPEKYQLCGVAADGREAYGYVQSARPDVVIADIKMPVMDGLELMRRTAVYQPNIYFIIISNYAEFSYAREAVACGAFQYLLKAELEREDIYNLLDQLQGQRSQARVRRKGTVYGRKLPELCDLRECGEDPERLRWFWSEWGMDCGRPFGVLVTPGRQEETLPELAETVERRNPSWYTLLPGPENVFAAFQAGDLEACADDLAHGLFRTRRSPVGVGPSESLFSEGLFPFQAAKNALAVRFLRGEDGVYFYPQEEKRGGIPSEQAEEEVRSFLALVEDGQYRHAARACAGVFETVRNLAVPAAGEGRRLCRMIYLSVRQCRGSGQEEPDEPECLPEYAACCEGWLDSLAVNALPSHAEAVRSALVYIQAHYPENITLPDLAARVYLSPEYFCRLFKEETGENFSTYLMLYRLHKAKKLLRTTDRKVSRIAAEVGYTSHSYFSRIYKRYMGKSPEQERGCPG